MSYVPRPAVAVAPRPYGVRARTVVPRPYYGRPTGVAGAPMGGASAAGAGLGGAALGGALGALGGTLGCLLCLSAIGALGLFSCVVAITAYTKQILDDYKDVNFLNDDSASGQIQISFLVLFASLLYVYMCRVRRI